MSDIQVYKTSLQTSGRIYYCLIGACSKEQASSILKESKLTFYPDKFEVVDVKHDLKSPGVIGEYIDTIYFK